jgi:hypothetical protein
MRTKSKKPDVPQSPRAYAISVAAAQVASGLTAVSLTHRNHRRRGLRRCYTGLKKLSAFVHPPRAVHPHDALSDIAYRSDKTLPLSLRQKAAIRYK